MQRREWEVWTRCEKCRDLNSIVFWVRKTPFGHAAILEKSTGAACQNGQLIHRPGHCDGTLVLLDPMPSPNTRLDG